MRRWRAILRLLVADADTSSAELEQLLAEARAGGDEAYARAVELHDLVVEERR